MAPGVGQVIAVDRLRVVMAPGVGRVIAAERHQVGTVPGTRRVLMGQRHQAVMTTITVELITAVIIHQRLSTLIQRIVLLVGVGMPQGPQRQEPS